jgi:putative transposase
MRSNDMSVYLFFFFPSFLAIMDWYSRYVISWELSTSLEADFCVLALERALEKDKPEIFNSDQGSQFTSMAFTKVLKSNDIKISMDGRGRVFDNILIERLWRSLKYEKVYLSEWKKGAVGLGRS